MRKGKSHFKVRWIFGLLSFWALCYNYAAKVILPATLEAMVVPEGGNFDAANEDFEDVSKNRTISLSHPASKKVYYYEPELFDWNLETQNVLKEAFFYGYIWTGIIGGRLAERLSVRHTVGTAVLISSLAALIFPYLTKFGVTVTFVVRFIQGMCNGMIYPGLNCIFPRYIPINERSIWGSIIYSGSSLGTLIMLNLSGVLCESPKAGGWRSAYYILGGSGLLWYISWLICIAERPHKNPFMSEKEYNEISAGTALDRTKKKHPIPWLKIATSPPFYAIGLSAFVYNWAYLTMLTQLPKYLHRVLDFSIEQADEVASLPYVAQSLFGYAAGFILDRMRRGGKYSITFLRKTFNTIGFLGAALCLFSLCFAGTDKWIAVTLLSLTLGFCGVSTVGFKITNVDMSPSFAGTLLGIANTIGNLPGILAPMLVSQLVSERHSIGEWNRVFIISACVFIVGALIFITFASAEVQSWDPISQEINEGKPEKIADVTTIANELRFEEIQLHENETNNNNNNNNNFSKSDKKITE